MINKTILEQVKKLVFGEEPQTPVAPATPAEPVKMMVDVTLEDGTTILKVDKLDVGGIVTLNDMPAPDGEHKLADGKVIKTSGGVIVEVVPVVAELEQKAAPLVPEEMKQNKVQMLAQLQKFAEPGATPDLQKLAVIVKACFESAFGWQIRESEEKATRDAAIATYKATFSAQEKENKTLKEAVSQLLKFTEELNEKVGKFGEQSKVKPAEPVKSWEQMTPLEKRRATK